MFGSPLQVQKDFCVYHLSILISSKLMGLKIDLRDLINALEDIDCRVTDNKVILSQTQAVLEDDALPRTFIGGPAKSTLAQNGRGSSK